MKLLPALLLAMSSSAHAGYLHLCPPGSAPQGGPRITLAGLDAGIEATVAVTDARPQLPGCRALPLGVDAAQVESLYPLRRGDRAAGTILLYGPNKLPFTPSSHELPQPAAQGAAAGRVPVPLRANLLAAARVRSFGVEERVRVEFEDGRLRLQCAAGTRAAGVLIDGPWTLPLAELRLAARYSASAGFALQAADEESAARETAHALGNLAAAAAPRKAALALPAALDHAGWRQFVIQCPRDAASLDLASLALEPHPVLPPRPRSTWIWERGAWMDDADKLLAWSARERIGELFIVVTLEGPTVREPARLAAFVRRATRAGVKVTAVEGDPHMVLPAQRAATLDRARAYAAYNGAAAAEERLAGLQFDIEPYLLADTVLAPEARDAEYLALVRALRGVAGGMPIEYVVPFWWSDKTDLLEGLADAGDGLAVMDYRTDPEQIVRFAVPFLDWGAANGKRVRIALEAGDVGAELQRRYGRVDAGEVPGDTPSLLLADTGVVPVLVLLRGPVTKAAMPLYRLSGERILDGSATSFYGRPDALRALLPGLERDFRAWQGFAGIALHGWR